MSARRLGVTVRHGLMERVHKVDWGIELAKLLFIVFGILRTMINIL